ncbi:MAG TPA: hypothetical protein PK188_04440 [Thermosynergistes sp.]|nr:hypothetical protein [Thermosynergistes sp.]
MRLIDLCEKLKGEYHGDYIVLERRHNNRNFLVYVSPAEEPLWEARYRRGWEKEVPLGWIPYQDILIRGEDIGSEAEEEYAKVKAHMEGDWQWWNVHAQEDGNDDNWDYDCFVTLEELETTIENLLEELSE